MYHRWRLRRQCQHLQFDLTESGALEAVGQLQSPGLLCPADQSTHCRLALPLVHRLGVCLSMEGALKHLSQLKV